MYTVCMSIGIYTKICSASENIAMTHLSFHFISFHLSLSSFLFTFTFVFVFALNFRCNFFHFKICPIIHYILVVFWNHRIAGWISILSLKSEEEIKNFINVGTTSSLRHLANTWECQTFRSNPGSKLSSRRPRFKMFDTVFFLPEPHCNPEEGFQTVRLEGKCEKNYERRRTFSSTGKRLLRGKYRKGD